MPPKLDRCVTTVMNSDRMKEKYPDEKTRQSHAFAICNASIKSDEGHMLYTTKLGEQDDQGWIHILPITKVEHPRYGSIEVTPQKIDSIIKHFDARTRGIDLDIDYAHKTDPSKGQKAAGWIKQLQSRGDGLWAFPDWTPKARQEIEEREWRYMSSELSPDMDLLLGAALTNRPFMKNLAPINLSELLEDEDEPTEPDEVPTDEPVEEEEEEVEETEEQEETEEPADEEEPASLTEIKLDDNCLVYTLADSDSVHVYRFRDIPQSVRKGMSSSDFAGKGTSFPIKSCADVMPAFRSLGRAGADNYDTSTLRRNIIRIAKRKGCTLPKSAQMSDEGGEMETKKLAEILKLDEGATEEQIAAEIKKLVEPKQTDEKTRKFAEEFPEEYEKMQALQRKDRERDADAFVSELHEAGMPAKHDAKIKAFMLGEKTVKLSEDGTEVAVSFADILKSVVETGKVDLKDRGGSKSNQGELGEHTFDAAVKKFQEENKEAGYMEAVTAVAAAEPELYKQYLFGAPMVGGRREGGE